MQENKKLYVDKNPLNVDKKGLFIDKKRMLSVPRGTQQTGDGATSGGSGHPPKAKKPRQTARQRWRHLGTASQPDGQSNRMEKKKAEPHLKQQKTQDGLYDIPISMKNTAPAERAPGGLGGWRQAPQ